nr:RNA-directed DNA polymerase, eukaryota [Tanacetum cinerariifolium]
MRRRRTGSGTIKQHIAPILRLYVLTDTYRIIVLFFLERVFEYRWDDSFQEEFTRSQGYGYWVVDDCIVLRLIELKNNLLKLTEMEAKDRIQKSKVKWAVEGYENSKFFHGIINKKRSQLAIRGVFVDGIWRSDPVVSPKVATHLS